MGGSLRFRGMNDKMATFSLSRSIKLNSEVSDL
jgi:hypothetical protein